MLCSEIPSISVDDRPLSMSEWEKADLEKSLDFSCVYERKAHCELQASDDDTAQHKLEAECRCIRQDSPRCPMHREFFPSLEAINEEEGSEEAAAVKELDKKYDLSLPHRHYHAARNKGYLQHHHRGRHFRKKTFAKHDDFPRRERSVTF